MCFGLVIMLLFGLEFLVFPFVCLFVEKGSPVVQVGFKPTTKNEFPIFMPLLLSAGIEGRCLLGRAT